MKVCVIGARGGSKGLKNKNIKQLLGKPLIAWSIETALQSKYIDEVYISTDCKDIAETAKRYGAKVEFMRPDELANDSAGKWEVWQHALSELNKLKDGNIDTYIDLDCTSPLRDVSDIDRAIELYETSKCDGVFSVCEARKNPYFNVIEANSDGFFEMSKTLANPIVRRQDAPKVYEHVASIYVMGADYIKNGTGLLSGKTIGYDIGQEKCFDVDSELDFELVEYFMRKKLNEQSKR